MLPIENTSVLIQVQIVIQINQQGNANILVTISLIVYFLITPFSANLNNTTLYLYDS